ncbi:DMT family transporter [Ectopseudomonas mendocina]|uniref:DMT family transporter n=1 Tax=Ectopseudomonas mendocina TaxID=300 RepID=A0ABZ2RNF1_ECTME
MSGVRKEADLFLFGLMVGLCALWGSQGVVIKLAAQDIAPMLQAALRSGIAALLVACLLAWRRDWMEWVGSTWRAGLLAGVLFCMEFLLIAQGLQYTSASHMSVLLYTAPIFSALGLHLMLPNERLRWLQWLGVGICFIGIVVAFAWDIQWSTINRTVLLGDALGLLAGVAFGGTTVVVRGSRLSEGPVQLTLFYQLATAFVLLLVYAVLSGQIRPLQWSYLSVGSVLYQGVLVSFLSYLAWFWLLRRYLASHIGVFAFMTPMYGVLFGVWVLDEPLTANFIVGAVLVLAGIMLVGNHAWVLRQLKRY